jgi:antitoxin component YwqK of YwqJK toxin-antitoxin module
MTATCCQICFEEVNESESRYDSYCGDADHLFCQPCLVDWVKATLPDEMVYCPICRKELFCAYEGWVLDGVGVTHDSRGRTVSQCTYVKGKREGIYREFYSLGGELRLEETYRDGLVEGVSREWYTNGMKRSETFYRRGKKDGFCRAWYETGQMMHEIWYQHDDYHGLYQTWRFDGIKELETSYYRGEHHGLFRRWRSGGELESDLLYSFGELVSNTTYYPRGGKRSEQRLLTKEEIMAEPSLSHIWEKKGLCQNLCIHVQEAWDEDGSRMTKMYLRYPEEIKEGLIQIYAKSERG